MMPRPRTSCSEVCVVLLALLIASSTPSAASDSFSWTSSPFAPGAGSAESLGAGIRYTFRSVVDATGLDIPGLQCQPDSWDTPTVRCVLALLGANTCNADGICHNAAPAGMVVASDWQMRQWRTLVSPSECPDISVNANAPDLGVNCTEAHLRRLTSTTTRHVGVDAQGRMRAGVCTAGGMLLPSDIRLKVLSSIYCTFDGATWQMQLEMPISINLHSATSHNGSLYFAAGFHSWPQSQQPGSTFYSGVPNSMWRAIITPCTAADAGVRAGCTANTPWAVQRYVFFNISAAAGGPGSRVFSVMASLYGINRYLGHPDLRGVQGAPWDEQARSVSRTLVYLGGSDREDAELFRADMWAFIDRGETAPNSGEGIGYWQRITASLPAPPPPIYGPGYISNDEIDPSRSGSYFITDYFGAYNVPGSTLLAGQVPEDTWAYASGALILFAGAEPYISVNGGKDWSRIVNFDSVDTVRSSNGNSSGSRGGDWGSRIFSSVFVPAPTIAGVDDGGAFMLRGPAQSPGAYLDVATSVSAYTVSCAACNSPGTYSSGCTTAPYDRQCLPCSTCKADIEYLVRECAPPDAPESDTVCFPCTRCGVASIATRTCNDTHDTVCVESAGGVSAASWMQSIGALLASIVFVAAAAVSASAGALWQWCRRELAPVGIKHTALGRMLLVYVTCVAELSTIVTLVSLQRCEDCGVRELALAARAVVAAVAVSLGVQLLVGACLQRRFVRMINSQLHTHRQALLDLQLQHSMLTVLLHGASFLHSGCLALWLPDGLLHAPSPAAKHNHANGAMLRVTSTANIISLVTSDLPQCVCSAFALSLAVTAHASLAAFLGPFPALGFLFVCTVFMCCSISCLFVTIYAYRYGAVTLGALRQSHSPVAAAAAAAAEGRAAGGGGDGTAGEPHPEDGTLPVTADNPVRGSWLSGTGTGAYHTMPPDATQSTSPGERSWSNSGPESTQPQRSLSNLAALHSTVATNATPGSARPRATPPPLPMRAPLQPANALAAEDSEQLRRRRMLAALAGTWSSNNRAGAEPPAAAPEPPLPRPPLSLEIPPSRGPSV